MPLKKSLIAPSVIFSLTAALICLTTSCSQKEPAPVVQENLQNEKFKKSYPIEANQTDLEKATAEIKLHPENAELVRNRGYLYTMASKYDEAIADYDKAIKMRPTETQWLLDRAQVYDSMEKPKEALQDMDKAIEMAPQNYLFYAQRADFYRDHGNLRNALVDYNKAISLDSEGSARLWRGKAYEKFGKYKEALADFERFFGKKDYLSREAYEEAAKIYVLQGNFERAGATLQKLCASDPSNDDGLQRHARLVFALGKENEAKAEYLKAAQILHRSIEKEPESSTYYESAADAFEHGGEPEIARDLRKKLVEITKKDQKKNSFNMDKWLELRLASLARKIEGPPYTSAIQSFSEKIAENPKNAQNYHDRGIAYFDTAQYEKAAADFQKAFEFEPKNTDYAFHLGRCYTALGQSDKTLQFCEGVIKSNPKDYTLLCVQAEAFSKKGEAKSAKEALKKAVTIDAFAGTPYILRAKLEKQEGNPKASRNDQVRGTYFEHDHWTDL